MPLQASSSADLKLPSDQIALNAPRVVVRRLDVQFLAADHNLVPLAKGYRELRLHKIIVQNDYLAVALNNRADQFRWLIVRHPRDHFRVEPRTVCASARISTDQNLLAHQRHHTSIG